MNHSRERVANFISELDTECPEGLFLYIYRGQLPPWKTESCEAIFEKYVQRRYGEKKLNVGTILGAAGALTIAEMYRLAGDEVSTRRLIARAVEEFPGVARLREYEASFGDLTSSIEWWKVLFPEPVSSTSSPASEQTKKLTKLNRRLRHPDPVVHSVQGRFSRLRRGSVR